MPPPSTTSQDESHQSDSFITNKLEQRLKREEQIEHADLVGLADDKNIIGAGAFGEVRKVQWRKVFAAAKIAKNELSPAEKALMLRELDVMAKCRHPNIVQFLGYVDTPFVIVMEWLPMGDLKAYWRARKISKGHKIRICIDVLCALAYLHNRRPESIIHRDIKPTNILMTKSGVAKLTDFGLGRFLHHVSEASKHGGDMWIPSDISISGSPAPVRLPNPSRDGPDPKTLTTSEAIKLPAVRPVPNLHRYSAVVGTAPYMAPEAVMDNYDEKLDIYSAAVTFYELFEQAPFDESIPFGWAITPGKVRSLIRKMGSTEPMERPCALDLIDMFRELQASGSATCSIA